MLERVYQARLIKKLRIMFPGCVILKNDSSYIQGIPDLTILWGTCWAMLEDKANTKSIVQPNQPYYVDLLNDMSFAAFICPENEAEVLYELQQAFQSIRDSRVS
jgi:hypothetical protein